MVMMGWVTGYYSWKPGRPEPDAVSHGRKRVGRKYAAPTPFISTPQG
jgi:hypothetical protein